MSHISHLYQISLSCVIGHLMCHWRLPTTDFQSCREGRGGRGGWVKKCFLSLRQTALLSAEGKKDQDRSTFWPKKEKSKIVMCAVCVRVASPFLSARNESAAKKSEDCADFANLASFRQYNHSHDIIIDKKLFYELGRRAHFAT
jgi:hypothetical protein